MFVAPLGDGGMYIVTSLKSGGDLKAARRLSDTEVERVMAENQQLKGQLAEADRRAMVEAARWRQQMETLQGLKSSFVPRDANLPCELIPARVVAIDSLPYGQMRVINRGRASGAQEGEPVLSRLLMTDRSKELPGNLAVISSSALAGCITPLGAGPFTSQIQLVTDSGFEINCRVVRQIDPNRPRQIQVLSQGAAAMEKLSPANNAPVIVSARGDGAGGMIVKDVGDYHNIQPGDWLMTNGDDPYLRTEIRIGTVTEVRPSDSHHVTLRIAPAVNFAAMRDVYIVHWKPF
jgi:cell shape-determining protein MreC